MRRFAPKLLGKTLAKLRDDTRGAAIIEFALLAPAMFALLLGVLQIGLGMHAYNSMRSIAADTARYAVTNYQTNTALSATAIQNQGQSIAISPPYALISDNVVVTVEDSAVQRVTGASEMTITIDYRVPTVLSVIGIDTIPLHYSRPIFVVDLTPAASGA